MLNRNKTNNSDQVIEFLQKKIANLENPGRFEVGMKIRAKGKDKLNHIVYEGDVIETSFHYKPEDTGIEGFSSLIRINSYKVYNVKSKTVHDITDLLFDIEFYYK